MRFNSRTRFRPLTASAAVAVALIAIATPAGAQETRETLQAAERADKATRLHPYEPGTLERRLEMLDRVISSKRPVYLFMGGPVDGAGFAFGPGYRARYGDTGAFDAHATWSMRNYKAAEATLKLPTFGNGRVALAVRGNWLDAPSMAFFGVGSDSSKDNRTNYLFRSTSVGASARVKLTKQVGVGASLDAISLETASVAGKPAIAAIAPNYRNTALFAEFDTRTSPDYSRRGGLYRVEWSNYSQTNAGTHSFRRVDAEVQRFVPLLRENWVLAFRAAASTTDTASGRDVPYFLMPHLGGSHMLRGFSSYRFRDRHSLLLTGEYRWTAGPLVDMALFMDAGKVAARRSDLNFQNLEVSHGIGFRIHTPSATVTRIELARSREGTSVIFSFSPSF